ncbi:hypothetical protein IG631_13023 [Alternaria alternata]|nr:hypothetical protein IG631_13023 [Alternaria alternata]
MARVKPTAATAAHNNTLPSHSTVASNMAMARKLVSVVNQDMVGQHQVTGKVHHMEVHQVAMDNKHNQYGGAPTHANQYGGGGQQYPPPPGQHQAGYGGPPGGHHTPQPGWQ